MDDTNTDIVITGDGVANFTPGSQTNGSAPHSTVKLRPLSATERSRRHRQRKRDAAATRPATDASVAGPVTSRVAPAIAMQRTLGAVIAVVGIGLSIAGMFASTRYAIMTTTGADRILAAGVAVAADLLTLTLPSGTIAIWRAKRRGLALASVLLWLAAAAITTTNLSGFFGAKADIFMSGRETATTARTLVLERVARLRDERDTISESRPVGVIIVAIRNATKATVDQEREALAIAKRRDDLDAQLATIEPTIAALPAVNAIDPASATMSDTIDLVTGVVIGDDTLRRVRLALLLGLPLVGGLVLAVGAAVAGLARGT